MCEFKVMLDGKEVFKDAVYALDDGQHVLVRDILGQSMEFPGNRVAEISVQREELTLTRR
jgi:predicted RNA-binding protein